MQSLTQQLKTSRYIGQNRYLTEMDFGMMLLLAGVVHLLGILAYQLMPDAAPDEVPVKVLNVRLGVDTGTNFDPYGFGDGKAEGTATENAGLRLPSAPQAEVAPSAPAPAKSRGAGDEAAQMHPAVTALDQMLSQEAQDEIKKNKKRKKAEEAARMPMNQGNGVRYVRREGQWGNGNPAETGQAGEGGAGAAAYGSPLGNSTEADAELLRRYEQVISLWIKRYVSYPEAAYSQNSPQGKAKVLIRVDKDGKLLGYRIQESTGHEVLDRSIKEILYRANPLPKNPNFQSSLAYQDFVISMEFKP